MLAGVVITNMSSWLVEVSFLLSQFCSLLLEKTGPGRLFSGWRQTAHSLCTSLSPLLAPLADLQHRGIGATWHARDTSAPASVSSQASSFHRHSRGKGDRVCDVGVEEAD